MLPRAITGILIGLSIAAPVQKAVDLHDPMVTIGTTAEYGMKVTYKFPERFLDNEYNNVKIIDNNLVVDLGPLGVYSFGTHTKIK